MAPRALLLLLIGILLLASAAPPVGAAGPAADADVERRTVEITAHDGTVLVADVYWDPAWQEPRPAVLVAHGWGQSRADMAADAEWLAGLGHVVLAWDARGFGASGGTVGLNGPDERADVAALVSWLARSTEPEVLLDSAATDDPRVGMYGASYGGAIQLLAAADDDRLDALVPQITWNDLAHSLAPDTVVKRGWVDLLFFSGAFSSYGMTTADPNTGGMDDRLAQWYMEAQATGRFPAEAYPVLEERSPALWLDQVDVPVLLIQGWRDTLFDPDEALRTHAVLSARADVDTHLVFHGGGHGHAPSTYERDRLRALVEAFLARHLVDDMEAEPLAPVVWWDASAADFRTAAAWPPPDRTFQTVGAARGAADVLLAQAGAPSSHTEAQEFEGRLGPHRVDAPAATSAAVPLDVAGPVRVLGAPVVRVRIETDVSDLTLFFSLLDRDPAGHDRVVANQVTALRPGATSGLLELPLVSVAHTLPAGHTLLLRVTTSDSGYLGGRQPGVVSLEAATLEVALPVLPAAAVAPVAEQPAGGDGQDVPGPGAGALVVAVWGGLWWARHKGRTPPGRPPPAQHS